MVPAHRHGTRIQMTRSLLLAAARSSPCTHRSDPAALLPPPLTSLADLETDALAYVLACLAPADLARAAASARRLLEAVEAATDLRASRFGVCLAPFRGPARLELLAIKETVKHEQQSRQTSPRVSYYDPGVGLSTANQRPPH